jgi:DNA polymerase III subunit epsilon
MAEALLESSTAFSVGCSNVITDSDGTATRLGLFVDVETTGARPRKERDHRNRDDPFQIRLDGRIFEVQEPFEHFHEPSAPIPDEITRLTGNH